MFLLDLLIFQLLDVPLCVVDIRARLRLRIVKRLAYCARENRDLGSPQRMGFEDVCEFELVYTR